MIPICKKNMNTTYLAIPFYRFTSLNFFLSSFSFSRLSSRVFRLPTFCLTFFLCPCFFFLSLLACFGTCLSVTYTPGNRGSLLRTAFLSILFFSPSMLPPPFRSIFPFFFPLLFFFHTIYQIPHRFPLPLSPPLPTHIFISSLLPPPLLLPPLRSQFPFAVLFFSFSFSGSGTGP